MFHIGLFEFQFCTLLHCFAEPLFNFVFYYHMCLFNLTFILPLYTLCGFVFFNLTFIFVFYCCTDMYISLTFIFMLYYHMDLLFNTTFIFLFYNLFCLT